MEIGGFYGGSIGNLFAYWEQAGFFSYVLPFLLIFAITFGILSKIQMFGAQAKGINGVIAICVGLLSLQFNAVPLFFSDIFPRIGIGLSVILALFILVGLFLPATSISGVNYMLFGVGAITFLVVISKSFADIGYSTDIGYFLSANLPAILTVVVVLAAIGAVFGKPDGKIPAFPPQNWQHQSPRGP